MKRRRNPTLPKKKINKKALSLFRLAIALVVFLIFFLTKEQEIVGNVSLDGPATLFCNTCADDLKKTFLKAISEASKSIDLYIYTLKDRDLIQALNKKAEEGIRVQIIHDPSTSTDSFSQKIKTSSLNTSGLMHLKILILDEEKVWIGSANFTRDSLKVHDNLVVAIPSSPLALSLIHDTGDNYFSINNQKLEIWRFPKEGKDGLSRLIQLLDQAERSLKIAMFTWTHPELTEAVIRAAKRGVKVEVLMDHGQAIGVNSKSLERLKHSQIPVRLSDGRHLLHHKFVWIDESVLASGSANWTKSAFFKNRDCLIILHNLSEEQQKKMQQIWQKSYERTKKFSLSANEKHFPIFGKSPKIIRYPLFHPITMAA